MQIKRQIEKALTEAAKGEVFLGLGLLDAAIYDNGYELERIADFMERNFSIPPIVFATTVIQTYGGYTVNRVN